MRLILKDVVNQCCAQVVDKEEPGKMSSELHNEFDKLVDAVTTKCMQSIDDTKSPGPLNTTVQHTTDLQCQLEEHKELLRDLGLGPPSSLSKEERSMIRARISSDKQAATACSTPPSCDQLSLPYKRKHSYDGGSSFGIDKSNELGTVQIYRGTQKKGTSYVIDVGNPSEFRLDKHIVPVTIFTDCRVSVPVLCDAGMHVHTCLLQVGFQFIRSWAGHDICGRTVRQPEGVGLELRLGRATMMDREFVKSVTCTVFPKKSSRPNPITLSLKRFMTDLTKKSQRVVNLPQSLILWTGMFTDEVQQGLRRFKKFKGSKRSGDAPVLKEILDVEHEAPAKSDWSANYESQIVRDVFQMIVNRSCGHRRQLTTSLPIVKTRVHAIFTRLLNHLSVRSILDGNHRSEREVKARDYVIQCLQYWYPRLQERHDKAGSMLYRAIGEVMRGYPDHSDVVSGARDKLHRVCARMFPGAVTDKWCTEIDVGNVRIDGVVTVDRDVVARTGTTVSWNLSTLYRCATEDTLLNVCVNNFHGLAEEEWRVRIERGRVRVNGTVIKELVDVDVNSTVEHFPDRQQHRAVASLLSGDITKRVSTSNISGNKRRTLPPGQLMTLDRTPRSEFMANSHWQMAAVQYFLSDDCSRLLGDKKNVKTMSEKCLTRRLKVTHAHALTVNKCTHNTRTRTCPCCA